MAPASAAMGEGSELKCGDPCMYQPQGRRGAVYRAQDTWMRHGGDACTCGRGGAGAVEACGVSQHGHSMATAWPQHGHSMVTAWSQHGHSMATAWSVPRPSMLATSSCGIPTALSCDPESRRGMRAHRYSPQAPKPPGDQTKTGEGQTSHLSKTPTGETPGKHQRV